ncbi:MAG: cation transporter [Bradymonadales bacterium]|nr:cation transporter [Bradymonadales bacterium]
MREDPLSRWLIARFAPDSGNQVDRKAKVGLLEGYTSIAINTLLFAAKLVIGLTIGSIALIADAIHTLGDSITSVVVIAGSYVSRKPADRRHPFGHERAEAIATLVIAVLLGVAAIELGKSSMERVWHPQPLSAPNWAIIAVAATMGIKQWLSQFALTLARQVDSNVLKADAWHHLTDVFATGLVLIGIIGARYHVYWLDGVMGLLVCAIILLAAYLIARDSLSPLLGEAPTPEEVRAIAEKARGVEGVLGVHDIVVHRYGTTRIVTLHVETSHKLGASELHAIAETVEQTVASGHGGHGTVVVHVDPIDREHPEYELIEEKVRQAVEADDRLESFHDLRVTDEGGQLVVDVDLCSRNTLEEADRQEIQNRFDQISGQQGNPTTWRLHFDPAFAYGSPQQAPGDPGSSTD